MTPASADKPVDWGLLAQEAAENHLYACDEWFDYEEGDGERPAGEPPSCAPYCGCLTCIIREVLSATWPILEEAVRSGDFDPPWVGATPATRDRVNDDV